MRAPARSSCLSCTATAARCDRRAPLAESIIDAFPAEAIAEIHLAGHSADPVLGEALLVDTHDAPIAPAVWALYQRLVARIGPRPTLVERDDNLPAYAELDAERARAAAVLAEAVAHPAEAFA